MKSDDYKKKCINHFKENFSTFRDNLDAIEKELDSDKAGEHFQAVAYATAFILCLNDVETKATEIFEKLVKQAGEVHQWLQERSNAKRGI